MKNSDEALLRELAGGNTLVFSELVNRYQLSVFRICLKFLKNREDAEEIAQDVFVQLYEGAGNFQFESKVSTWIYRIAVNKSLEKIRWRNRKKRFGLLFSLDFGKEIRAKSDFPDSGIEEGEMRDILNKKIDDLPENQKTAFILHKVRGIAQKDIAEIMELSESAVESLLFRAKGNLRKSLGKYFDV